MFESIVLPKWLFGVLLVLALWAAVDKILLPLLRRLLRGRVEKVLDDLDRRLPIRIQPFKLTKRAVLLDRLVYDQEVVQAAEEFAHIERITREEAMRKVKVYANEIVPAFNAYVYFRFGYWLAKRVAESLYRVRLGFSDDEGLAAVDPESTIIFVMNHRSNMDYVLISYLAAEKTALSYAVGEWARIFPLESLIRSMGAYFVRRRSRNQLYRKVLQRYVQTATKGGVTQAVFPEGGLSRDGKLLEPKLGLLDYMLRSFDPQSDRDVVFVPVGVNYDRVLEDRTLLLDAGSRAERKSGPGPILTTLSFILKNFRLMFLGRWYKFGYALVNFGSPISAREHLKSRGLDLRSLEKEERFDEVGLLGQRLMDEIGKMVPASPVSLVATAMLEDSGQALSELDLKGRVLGLIDRLETTALHRKIRLPRHDLDYAITVGIRMLSLRHILILEQGLYRANPDEIGVLRYYANSIAHRFASV